VANFKDNSGKDWQLTIDVNALRRVKEGTSVDLMRILEPDFLMELGNDVITLVGVLWSVVELQADRAGITPEDFGASLTGESLDNATSALIDGIADFFPPNRALILRKIKAKADQTVDQATAQILEILDKQPPAMFGEQSTNTQA
jgi:hypothetical protein